MGLGEGWLGIVVLGKGGRGGGGGGGEEGVVVDGNGGEGGGWVDVSYLWPIHVASPTLNFRYFYRTGCYSLFLICQPDIRGRKAPHHYRTGWPNFGLLGPSTLCP